MKYIVIFLVLASLTVRGQNILKFEKRFVESEHKWVAFKQDKEGFCMYGFIYIDAQAGLTFNYEGKFKIAENGVFTPTKLEKKGGFIKTRLEPNNNVLVAFLPPSKFQELQINAVPEWLKGYKTDTAFVVRLYRWGFSYNAWNECARGLSYLERAQKINPEFKGLSVELAFSYNCLGRFEKAVAVLQNALVANPTDAYINKELIYAQVHSGQLVDAQASCLRAIKLCADKTYNGENCYNILQGYYKNKDKKGFNAWLSETKKWTASDALMASNIKVMESEFAR